MTRMQLRSKDVFYRSPGKGTLVYGVSYYTRSTGGEKICRRSIETRSDLTDSVEVGYSSDNGKTWSDLEPTSVVEETPAGVHRCVFLPGFVDPETGRLLELANECLLPNDDCMEAMEQNFL